MLSDVLHDFTRAQPEQMDLPLAKVLPRRSYPLKFPRMPSRHCRLHRHSFIFCDRFQIFEAKIVECRPKHRKPLIGL